MSTLTRYAHIWKRMASMSLQAQITHPLGSVGFLLGKLIRLFFFFAFVVAIFSHTKALGGYSLVEMALFFLTFNLVDITAQIFFRGIYGARRTVAEGDFDFYLIQPCSPLFRMALTSVDFLDILTIVPVLVLCGIVGTQLPAGIAASSYLIYFGLTLNGIALAMALHVFVGGLAVRTQELENSIWIYRNMMFMGRFPVDIYGPLARALLTYVFPLAVMVTFPAQALLGKLSAAWIIYSFGVCLALSWASLWFWRESVNRYTSSSS